MAGAPQRFLVRLLFAWQRGEAQATSIGAATPPHFSLPIFRSGGDVAIQHFLLSYDGEKLALSENALWQRMYANSKYIICSCSVLQHYLEHCQPNSA
jgi:hypothetical protein